MEWVQPWQVISALFAIITGLRSAQYAELMRRLEKAEATIVKLQIKTSTQSGTDRDT